MAHEGAPQPPEDPQVIARQVFEGHDLAMQHEQRIHAAPLTGYAASHGFGLRHPSAWARRREDAFNDVGPHLDGLSPDIR